MEKTQKPFYKTWWFIIIMLLSIILLGCFMMKKTINTESSNNELESELASTNESDNTNSSSDKQDENKVTYENFMKISLGMSYDEVKAILGDGEEESSIEFPGMDTAAYRWKGENSSSIAIMLQNGEVGRKVQTNMQEMDAQITLDKYNQIKEGMSYDEVKAILGEGQLKEISNKILFIATDYEYKNKDNSYAIFSFKESKLESKYHNDLK